MEAGTSGEGEVSWGGATASESIYSQIYPARLKLRTARPAAGGDKARKGMGPSSQLFSLFP